MPFQPFQFNYLPQQTYQSPYVQAIAEALGHQSDPMAQALITKAQAAGSTAQSIGNAASQLAAIPQHIEAAKNEALKNSALKLQVDDAQRVNRSRSVFETELKNPQNYNPDGTVNDSAITERLKQQDVGAWQQWSAISAANAKNSLDMRSKLAEINKNEMETQEKARQIRQAASDYLGRLAYVGEKALQSKPDDPLHARDTALATVARAAADGVIAPSAAQQMTMRLATASPAQVGETLAAFVPQELRAKFEKEAADTAKASGEAKKLAAETANLEKYGRPTPPEAQHVDFLLDGKPVKGVFVPSTTGGTYQYGGQDVTTRVQPIPRAQANTGGMAGMYNQTDPKAIAEMIMRGEREPDTSNLGRPISAAVDTLLAKAGYNKALALTDWKATQKHIATLNGAQQLRLNQAINSLPDMLDSVDALASEWKGGRFPTLNKANLALAKGGAYGSDVASVANKLDAQIADVTADLGNVYMGGNSPTDHALQLAGKSLKGEWDEKVLHDMVGLAKKNVVIRKNSIANTGVAGARDTNPYQQPQSVKDPLNLFGK